MPDESPLADAPRGLIAATFTPLDASGDLAVGSIPPMVDRLVDDGVEGLFVGGSTGEGISLTTAERRDAAAAFVAAAADRLSVLVHVGHNSLRDACDLAAHAADIGAAGIAVTAPSYFKPAGIPGLIRCLGEIATATPALPLYYYHIPRFTGLELDLAEFLERAGDAIPSLRGVKFSDPALHVLQHCIDRFSDRHAFYFGADEMYLSGLIAGARGAVGSTYNFAAPLYHAIRSAYEAGDLSRARELQSRAIHMIEVIVRHRVLSGLKATMRLVGIDCGPNRLPLETLDDAEIDELRAELDAIGFFQWAREGSGRR